MKTRRHSLEQSVQRTLRFTYVLMGGVVLVAFVASLVYGQFLVSRLNTVYEDRVLPLHDLQRIGHQINVHIPQRFWAGEYESLGPGVLPLDADWAEVETTWRRYLATYLTPQEVELAASVRSSLDQLQDQLLPAGRSHDARLAFGRDAQAYARAVKLFNERLSALSALQVEVAQDNLQRARAASQWAAGLAAVVLLALLLLAVYAFRTVVQGVVQPVRWVSRSLQRLADGDVVRQPPRFPLSAEFSELLDQMERVRSFVIERQRLRDAQLELEAAGARTPQANPDEMTA